MHAVGVRRGQRFGVGEAAISGIALPATATLRRFGRWASPWSGSCLIAWPLAVSTRSSSPDLIGDQPLSDAGPGAEGEAFRRAVLAYWVVRVSWCRWASRCRRRGGASAAKREGTTLTARPGYRRRRAH